MTGRKTKASAHHIGRSAGPQDVHPGWLLESATRAIGPYVDYPDGTVTLRATGEILWRPGDDPAKRPRNPQRELSDQPHTTRRGLS